MKQRIIIGFALGPIVLYATVLNPLLFLIICCMVVVVATLELFNLPKKKGVKPATGLAILFSLSMMITSYLALRYPDLIPPDFFGAFVVLFMMILILMFVARVARGDGSASVMDVAMTIFGAIYIGGFLSYVFRIKAISEAYFMVPAGHLQIDYLIAAPFIGAWACDTGAFFSGKLLGRHKMAPLLSPNKTWEGLIGGIASDVGAFAALCWVLKIPLYHCAGLGVSCAVLGQFGDLAVSAMKREVGAKDMGAILAAHGGLMDRIDSLLFTMPTVFYYFKFFVVK